MVGAAICAAEIARCNPTNTQKGHPVFFKKKKSQDGSQAAAPSTGAASASGSSSTSAGSSAGSSTSGVKASSHTVKDVYLKPGQHIPMVGGDDAVIMDTPVERGHAGLLGEGGQGYVYHVMYDGHERALKWYKIKALGSHADAMYENLFTNAQCEAPSPEFLWPMCISERMGSTFGYVMALRPQGFYDLTDFMLVKQRFPSLRLTIDAALHIVGDFRILHSAGYSYQDVNDGNFFLNPRTGQVLIVDNDNVVANDGGTNTNILGKLGYMAPEIVTGKDRPNTRSDRFSLAVVLFILMTLSHPLEGVRTTRAPFDPAMQKYVYGTNPVFVMDPDDDSNRPDPRVHRNLLLIWPCLPQHMRDFFCQAFSHEALTNPYARPDERDWTHELARLRSEVIRCHCGNEEFSEDGASVVCSSCHTTLQIGHRLDMGSYILPAIADTRIYRCQLGSCDIGHELDPVARVFPVHNDLSKLILVNLSPDSWQVELPDGSTREVPAKGSVPLITGFKNTMGKKVVTILDGIDPHKQEA